MSDPGGDPAEVALFGTSADPPTVGHRSLLAGLAQRFPLVLTWASDNPFKQHGAPLELRAALLQRVVEGLANPRLRLQQNLSSPRALTTLERAHELWPRAELVFVVGSDLLPQIQRWYGVDAILRRCRLAVVPRSGWPLEALQLEELQRRGGRVEVLPLQIPASASSRVRQELDPAQVPQELWPMLQRHRLYGLAAAADHPALR